MRPRYGWSDFIAQVVIQLVLGTFVAVGFLIILAVVVWFSILIGLLLTDGVRMLQ